MSRSAATIFAERLRNLIYVFLGNDGSWGINQRCGRQLATQKEIYATFNERGSLAIKGLVQRGNNVARFDLLNIGLVKVITQSKYLALEFPVAD